MAAGTFTDISAGLRPITDLTTGTVTGTGVFDQLMVAVKAHLEQEYQNGRIKGSDYATVYLGAVQATLAQSVQFLASQQTSDMQTRLLYAQKCESEASFDLLVEQRNKVLAEIALLNQKKVTEQAQTDGTNIDPASVIGKQNALYDAQKNGFLRDAEQKAAKLLVDTWNVRQTTDGALADTTNKLADTYIGDAVKTLLEGIGVTVV